MTKEQLQSLPVPLQQKLATLPRGATAEDFTGDEQAELESILGESWPTILGVG